MRRKSDSVRGAKFVVYHRPKLWAKYRREATVVPEVMSMTLIALFSELDKAPFLTQFAHWKSAKCQQGIL